MKRARSKLLTALVAGTTIGGLQFAGCVGDVASVSPGQDTGAAKDGGADVAIARCDITKPFGANAILPLSVNTLSDEFSPRLLPDELTLYFGTFGVSDGSVTAKVQVATRGNVGAPFGSTTPLSEVNAAGPEVEGPSPSANGLTLYFSVGSGGGGDQIYAASRSNVAAPYSNVAAIPALANPAASRLPFISSDDNEIWFSSTRDPSGTRLFHATRQGQAFVAPTLAPLTAPATKAFDTAPLISADGLTLYFARQTPSAGLDIFYAQRPTVNDSFGPPVAVTELNTSTDDAPGWLSADQCRLYFSSNRPKGAGGLDVWVAERTPY